MQFARCGCKICNGTGAGMKMPAPVYKRLSMDDFSFMSEVELDRLTQFFKLLADPTRVRLILLLSKGEWYVRELSDKLGTTQSAVSHQLSMLKSNHLVSKRRQECTTLLRQQQAFCVFSGMVYNSIRLCYNKNKRGIQNGIAHLAIFSYNRI